jgi:putative transposase
MVSPQAKRQAARYVEDAWHYSERQACRVVGTGRSSVRYQPGQRSDEAVLRRRIRELADKHKSYGYRFITALLRREGLLVNKKRVHRIWQDEGLQQTRRRVTKRRYGPAGETLHKAERRNHVWSYDFIEDRTENGNKIRILGVVDEFTRECLSIRAARSIPATKVIDTLEWLFLLHGAPEHIRSDNGPEFIAHAVQNWLEQRSCNTIYITPGSPWENPFIESFFATLRRECLDRHLFYSLSEAQTVLDAWRQEYNGYRPHSSLDYITPADYADLCATTPTAIALPAAAPAG